MSHLPALSSCTHTVWGHLRHPLCPSIPLWQKASVLGIAIIATYGGYLWLTRSSSASDGKEIRYNNSKNRDYQSKCPSFPAGFNAFDHTLLLILGKRLAPKDFINQLGVKVQQPNDTNMLFFARVLDEQKRLLKESIIKKSWQDPSTLEQAKKTMEAAYCLAFLALDELTTKEKDSRQQTLSSDDHYYKAAILDFFSLYHAIRSAGVINIDANGFTSYACSSDNLNTPYADVFYNNRTLDQRHHLRDLYNNIILRFDAEGLSIPKDWPAFEEDKVVTGYDCPLPQVNSIDFGPAYDTLNTLLGGNLDSIPTYNGKEPIEVKYMTAPIMKGVEGGMPFIAIRMNNTNLHNRVEQCVRLTHGNNQWYQVGYSDPYAVFPRFFFNLDASFNTNNRPPFTDSNGQVLDKYREDFKRLQKFILDGQGETQDGWKWELLKT